MSAQRRALARDLARALAAALDRSLDFALNIALTRGLDRAPALSLNSRGSRRAAHARLLGFARDVDRDVSRARAIDLAIGLDLVRDLELVRDLGFDLVDDLGFGLVRDLARGVARDPVRARTIALSLDRDLTPILTRIRAREVDRDLARDLVSAVALACDLTRRIIVALPRGPGECSADRVSALAGRLAGAAARLLPAADRSRYGAEWRSELWELAHAGAPRRRQAGYALRLLGSALTLRGALREPRRRQAAP